MWSRKPTYEHICYIHNRDRYPFMAYLRQEGSLDGETVMPDWRRNRSVSNVELVTRSKYMSSTDFSELLHGVIEDVREGHVADTSKHECVVQRLKDFDRSQVPEGGRCQGEVGIYTAVKKSEFPDYIFDPEDIGLSSCRIL